MLIKVEAVKNFIEENTEQPINGMYVPGLLRWGCCGVRLVEGDTTTNRHSRYNEYADMKNNMNGKDELKETLIELHTHELLISGGEEDNESMNGLEFFGISTGAGTRGQVRGQRQELQRHGCAGHAHAARNLQSEHDE
eukprot:2846946-Alexandrium_andersonii.AAC.1